MINICQVSNQIKTKKTFDIRFFKSKEEIFEKIWCVAKAMMPTSGINNDWRVSPISGVNKISGINSINVAVVSG